MKQVWSEYVSKPKPKPDLKPDPSLRPSLCLSASFWKAAELYAKFELLKIIGFLQFFDLSLAMNFIKLLLVWAQRMA